ncbi:MAG: hypothetical protein JWM90_920 [Thermoleophilia bacterium]|nr:hypothetical protein [Thermoleophilia bacterium]
MQVTAPSPATSAQPDARPLSGVSARITWQDTIVPRLTGVVELRARLDGSKARRYDSVDAAIRAAKSATKLLGQPVAVVHDLIHEPSVPGLPIHNFWRVAVVDVLAGADQLWQVGSHRATFTRLEANDVDQLTVYVPQLTSIVAVAAGATLLDRRAGSWIATTTREDL